MSEIVDFLRNMTHLARLTRTEVREVIDRLEAEGYAIVKIQFKPNTPAPAPVVEPPVDLPPPVEPPPAPPVPAAPTA